MSHSARPAVKICGVTREEDARAAHAAGAAFIGAVLVPLSPRAVTAERARALGESVPLPLVLVVADLGVVEASSAGRASGAAVLQLHGDEPPETLRALRQEGGWEIWKALRVREADALPGLFERYAPVADALLVDGWHPAVLGGAGARFSWSDAAPFRDALAPGIRLIVAGGLTPENVAEAVALLRPDVVDTSSGVERAPGIKDAARVEAFVRSARSGGRPVPDA